jgi:hypothetical protein
VSSTGACVNVELQFGQRNAQLAIKTPSASYFSVQSTLNPYRENLKILDYWCELKEIYVFIRQWEHQAHSLRTNPAMSASVSFSASSFSLNGCD